MQSRTRTFLTFSLFCLLPLLVISVAGFLANLTTNKHFIQTSTDNELWKLYDQFQIALADRRGELEDAAVTLQIREVVARSANTPSLSVSGNEVSQLSQVKEYLAQLLRSRSGYETIAVINAERRLILVGEKAGPEPAFRTESSEKIEAAESVWQTASTETLCDIVTQGSRGTSLRCTSPIMARQGLVPFGALVAFVNVESLITSVQPRSSFKISHEQPPAINVMMVDDSARIVYHTNDALKQQRAADVAPYLMGVVRSMEAKKTGNDSYDAPDGDTWLVSHAQLVPKLSLAVAQNYSRATRPGWILGWTMIASALLLGLAATWFLSNFYLKRTRSIDRVAAGVGAIAKGDLNHQIDLRSRDDLKPMADNLALMTQQLREQIAREAESRQFQSFVRLSAILTHDLKNSIEALSLTVSNMERHFDDPQFRIDAMKTLRGATDDLRALVTRLSNPVSTLSGEHKRPQPVDLVPLLKGIVAMTAEQAPEHHEIKMDLPASLPALVDAERMKKVMENLLINSLEAMAGKQGILTIGGGTTNGKVFFSVQDTGEGMSRQFIEEKLFHPFATTKRTGVGLGLYTCREVVRAHAGTIEVQSERGAGTTFRVVLPSAEISQRRT